jgi:hypothetical protein
MRRRRDNPRWPGPAHTKECERHGLVQPAQERSPRHKSRCPRHQSQGDTPVIETESSALSDRTLLAGKPPDCHRARTRVLITPVSATPSAWIRAEIDYAGVRSACPTPACCRQLTMLLPGRQRTVTVTDADCRAFPAWSVATAHNTCVPLVLLFVFHGSCQGALFVVPSGWPSR